MFIFESVRFFSWGVLKRFYLWMPPLLLDPFELYEEFVAPHAPDWAPERIAVADEWTWIPMGLLVFWAAAMTYHELRVLSVKLARSPLPSNRDEIVRLLTELQQRADEYFQKCASGGVPPKVRFLDRTRRPSVDKVVKKIEAEFRVASSEELKATCVEFQKKIDDIVAHGRNVTNQTLPGLRNELRTTVDEFLAALDRGDL